MFNSKFSLQLHKQKKSNKNHLDIRIINQYHTAAWSWAIPKSKFPEKNEKILIIKTADHSIDYMRFQGKLKNGDIVLSVDYGDCKVLVHKDNLMMIQFNGKIVSGVYNFIRLHSERSKSSWILLKSKR